MNLNDIKDNYRSFDDYKIEKIASEEAGSLRPEVFDILKNEIKRRGLNQNLINSVDFQNKELTEDEMKTYCTILQNHACPKCSSKTSKLHVSMIGRVVSMLVITNYQKSIKIACSDCLDQWNKEASMKSALLGWWGFPWGPIQTIRSFVFNSNMRKHNRTEYPSELFQEFVLGNIGVLEVSKTDPQKLTDFLIRTNRSN